MDTTLHKYRLLFHNATLSLIAFILFLNITRFILGFPSIAQKSCTKRPRIHDRKNDVRQTKWHSPLVKSFSFWNNYSLKLLHFYYYLKQLSLLLVSSVNNTGSLSEQNCVLNTKCLAEHWSYLRHKSQIIDHLRVVSNKYYMLSTSGLRKQFSNDLDI